MSPDQKNLLRGSAYYLGGQILPILVGLVTVPVLVHRIGPERFGILSLAWAILLYFSFTDLGVGRAIVRELSQGKEERNHRSTLIWSLLGFLLSMGAFVGLACWFSAPWLAHEVFTVPPDLDAEAFTSVRLIAILLPFMLFTNGLRGVLESHQRFGLVNVIQTPVTLGTHIFPLFATLIEPSIYWTLGSILIVRILGTFGFFWACYASVPEFRRLRKPQFSVIRGAFQFGGWLTLSNILAPTYQYLDRFWIGHILGMVAVAHYALPIEITSKFWIIPGSLVSVLFPAFASLGSLSKDTVYEIFQRFTKILLVVLVPPALVISLFAQEGLTLWMNAEFGAQGSLVLKILSFGIVINCLGFIPATLLQAANRPDIPAKIHLVMLPFFVVGLAILLKTFGLAGAALAFLLRVIADSSALFYFSFRTLHRRPRELQKWGGILVFIIGLFVISSLLQSPTSKLIFLVLAFAGFATLAWFGVFSIREQQIILNQVLDTIERPIARSKSPDRNRNIQKIGIALAAYCPNLDYFAAQLRSIQNQTFKNWICRIQFDSPMNELLQNPDMVPFLEDSRFVWVENTARQGFKKNFETAVRALVEDSTVDAVAFSDQDDVWYPNKLQVLIENLEKTPVGSIVFSDMDILMTYTDRPPETIRPTAWQVEHKVLENNRIFHNLLRNHVTGAACLFDADLARERGRIPESIPYHDHWFSFLASYKGRILGINQSLLAYRQHSSNVVGIVPFTSVLYLPPRWNVLTVLKKACRNWRRVAQFQREAITEGVRIPRFYSFILGSRLDLGFGLFLFGILNLFSDPPLARTCFVLGLGKLSSFLVSPYEEVLS